MAYTTIDDPSAYLQTVLWSGSGSGQAITNGGNSDLQPDFVWIKKRAGGSARAHGLYDSSRGVTKLLHSNTDGAESTQTAGLTAFGSDGFTVGSDDGVDGSGGTYVAWQWKANGGTTTTNDASATSVGSLDSVYQANTTAGFSIVTYTGAGGNQTIAHGLGVTPTLIFIKRRDDAGDWTSYHASEGDEKFLRLNGNNALGDQATYFNDTTPTSTVFTVGSAGDVNTSSGTHVAYCFAEIQGYSKFGKYTGNNSADGTFVYTGFKPAFILIKRLDSTGSWVINDSTRNPTNQANNTLVPDENWVETTNDYYAMDILSNGFKFRKNSPEINGSSTSQIFMAFAEHPFVSSEGVPCTAR
jgi:hypothetical protein